MINLIVAARLDAERAWADLAAAERELPEPDADTTMASAALLSLLGRVRATGERLRDLEQQQSDR